MIKQNTNFKKLIFYSFTLLLFIFILFQIKHISLAEDKTISKQNGHYFDCSLGFISESDEFLNNIYPEEKNNFNYTYTTSIKHEISDVYEYFASTFDEYIINPNGLKNDCPRTYEFMKNLIG